MVIESFKNDFLCEIGSSTILVRNVGKNESEIVDYNNVYRVPYNNKTVLDRTCKMFGSSLKGRIEGSRDFLKLDYKLPVMIDEIRNLVFFPLRSVDSEENIWISYNVIEDYNQVEDGIEILLKNGDSMIIQESFNVFENQYIRAYKLHKRMEKVKTAILN